ncbi:precorrin-8X methylmutase [Geobacter pelophilus]|uniref:Precorrin-8X methylmutase n=1 Tax=Geoanaerobacter pelophilus TaxID=60036 RepID=A0AAW4KZ33_9BACT|nr:precorrin-8X methylmutase [Geoanaerobacter pelophilus]MBT0663903.1 precorrin-8X methylmutase [Geoanaerobacter pelophilus]
MSVHLRPEEIEAESFRMIDEEAGPHSWPPAEWQIVRRAIHTSADFDYSRTMLMSPDAVKRGVAALQAGHAIVTDTTMALSGISRLRLDPFGISAKCLVADPVVAKAAEKLGVTRSLMAMRSAAADPQNGIFVIGNAPTALFELLRLVREEGLKPALVVGLPVGFVGAAESKEELVRTAEQFPFPYITNRGRKGGSNVAAAVVNALLILANG